jgi:hypothetical protein
MSARRSRERLARPLESNLDKKLDIPARNIGPRLLRLTNQANLTIPDLRSASSP